RYKTVVNIDAAGNPHPLAASVVALPPVTAFYPREDPSVSIHPLAAVSPYALVGNNVKIAPFCVVEPGVVIGDNCTLASRVVIRAGTSLGRDNQVFEGTVLGGLPQHLHMPEFPGRLVIGNGNVFRENVTVHRAMEADHAT